MAYSTASANAFIKLMLQGIPIANIADNAAAAPLTFLFLSLHTALPVAGGNQTTSEISYTGYARIPVARSAAGFTVVNNEATLVAAAEFLEMGTGAGGIATHFGVGTQLNGAGMLLGSGPLTPAITVAAGVLPRLKASSKISLLV